MNCPARGPWVDLVDFTGVSGESHAVHALIEGRAPVEIARVMRLAVRAAEYR